MINAGKCPYGWTPKVTHLQLSKRVYVFYGVYMASAVVVVPDRIRIYGYAVTRPYDVNITH